MGKLKRRNNKKGRVNPLGRPSANQGASGPQESRKDENTRVTKIVPLINKLQSSAPNDKSMAVGAITVLCDDERMRKLLLKERLVAIILEQCLTDENDEIVVESFGLLRNLGIEEGLDVLKHYWRSDIWNHIASGLAKIEKSFKFLTSNQEQKDKSKIQLLYDFTENILSLIMVLAGGSTELYDSIYSKIDPVLALIIDLISNQTSNSTFKIPPKLFNSLLEFVYEFSTESREFIEKLNTEFNFDLQTLVSYIEQNSNQYNVLTVIYLEGIKFNNLEALGGEVGKDQIGSEILTKVYDIISTIDVTELKQNIASTDAGPKKDSTVEDLTKDGNLRIRTKMELNSLEVALDLITSILEYLAVNEEDEPLSLSGPLLEILLKTTYPILYELLKFELSNNSVLTLTSKILTSLNNLVWLMLSNENLPVDWFEKCQATWVYALQASASNDLEVQKNCLSVLWGISKTVGPEASIDESMIISLIGKGQEIRTSEAAAAGDENLLELYLTLVGFLGSIAQTIGNTVLTGQISQFLVESIDTFKSNNKPSAAEIVIETLNHIYDIFGDKEYSYDYEVFVQQDYLSKLKALEPEVKTMYKKIDKNKYGQLRIRGEEAWSNLGRFIEYKESERN